MTYYIVKPHIPFFHICELWNNSLYYFYLWHCVIMLVCECESFMSIAIVDVVLKFAMHISAFM